MTRRRIVRVFLQETFGVDDVLPSESPFMSQAEMYGREDEPDFHKPKKSVIKLPKKLKAKVNPALRSVSLVAVTLITSKTRLFFFSFYYR